MTDNYVSKGLGLLCILIVVLLGRFSAVGAIKLAPTATFTPQPPTPRPPDTELIPVFEELDAQNENCTLPCLWGLPLESITISELNEFVQQHFNQELDCLPPEITNIEFNCSFFLIFEPGTLYMSFSVREDQVLKTRIDLVRSEKWLSSNPFALPEILDELGTPTQIFISIVPSFPLALDLVVVYDSMGIIVAYEIEPPNNTEYDPRNPIELCPQLDHAREVQAWFQSATVESPIIDNLPALSDNPPRYGQYWPFEQMTGVAIETAIEFFVNMPDDCLELPSLTELSSTLHITIFANGPSARESCQNPSDFPNIDVILRHLKSHWTSFRSPKNSQRCDC
jgi:hypothetical protein